MTAHTCHADNCDAVVPPRMFMCRKHWFSLPTPMRDAIWANYVPGQERRKDPTVGYLEAAHAAIEFLKTKEAAAK